MAEKMRKTETVQNTSDMVIKKLNKQKHNSKRRRCKNTKTLLSSVGDCDIGKADDVNFSGDIISKNESEVPLIVLSPAKIMKESTKSPAVCSGQNHYVNSKSNSTSLPLASPNDLSSLFENLQVHTCKKPTKSNNFTDFLNVNLLKKTNCESLLVEDLEKIKQEKLTKTLSKEAACIPDAGLREYINFSMIQNSPGTSVVAQVDSNPTKLVSNTERTAHSNLAVNKVKGNKNKNQGNSFSVDDLIKDKNSLLPSAIPTSKSLVQGPEKTKLKNESERSSKKFEKKKNRNEKTGESPEDSEVFSGNQRVFLNSGFQKNNANVHKPLESSATGKLKKKHDLKSSLSERDTKFPRHLSPEELKSVSNLGILLTGIIRINQKNYKEAYINAPDKGMDILIEGLKDRNRALEGDEVYFILKPKEHHRVNTDTSDVQRTAFVVGIKTSNHNRRAIGSLNVMKNKNNTFALFSPRDSRLPRIRISKNKWPKGFAENSNAFKDKLYFAKISHWNDIRYADGELVKEVGVMGTLEAETDAILLKYDLDVTPYSDALKKFLPPSTFKISEVDLKNREDFRKECVFTIDPPTSVDLDDAVSCKHLPNGNYEIGVHISDVSYFLKEGTPLDKAVCQRATTVYLVQQAFHMLPFELCRLCSLTPGEDKLAFSVVFEITKDCQIIKHRFTRSVINSCAQMSYDQVQAILDNAPSSESLFPQIHGGHTSEHIKDIILILNKVAVYLRNKRFNTGALRIDQKKIHFSLNENKLPTGYSQETHEPSHQLIEEFMLLANVTAAETLNSTFPKLAFLRSHPPPLSYVLEKLQKSFEKYGIILNISSSESIQASLLKYSGDDKESEARMLVLNNALAKPMARAHYYCSGLFSDEIDRRHFALNVSLYTHFTSPIRRYADVMVHRLLAASLCYSDPPHWSADYVQSVASNCNKQKYAAKMAQEMSIELYLALYIGQLKVMVCEAVVCDIKDKSFDCIGLSTGMHQRLYFEHIKGDVLQDKQEGVSRLIIKWPKDENFDKETIQIIDMFSIVKIELKRANVLKIEANLLRYK